MKFAWAIHVRDDKGAAVTDAKVSLVQVKAIDGKDFPFDAVAATHDHKSDGGYEPAAEITPAAGEWVLLVRKPKSSPVVQPFTLTAKGDDFTVTTPAGLAAPVDPKAGGPETAKSFNFTVTLYPETELVFVSGTDYFGKGVVFRIYAEGRAKGLFKILAAKKVAAENETGINLGTVITLFSCDEKARFTLAYSHTGGLVQVAKKSVDITALVFYKYLSDIGASAPGRVIEGGIFSHSFPGGAILFDTDDNQSNKPERDPADKDFRIKDFVVENTKGWPKLKEAFSKDARFQIWGCSATSSQKDQMTEASKVTKADQLFPVTTDEKTHDGVVMIKFEQMLTRQLLRSLLDPLFRKNNTYPAAAATFLQKPVFACPPGVGSNYFNVGPLEIMGVKGTASPYLFFKAEFSPDFEPTKATYNFNYIDYLKMQKRAEPPAPAQNPGIYLMTIDLRRSQQNTRLRFSANHEPPGHAGTNVKLAVSKTKGFVDAAKSGYLYVLSDLNDDSKSEAWFVEDGGELYKVERSPNGLFDLPTAFP